MKKNEIITLNLAIEEALLNESTPVKFRYALLKNKGIIAPEIEALQTIEKEYRKPLSEYDRQRNELIVKHGKEDAKRGYRILESDKEAFSAYTEGMKPLNEQFKKELAAYEDKMKEYSEKILSEETEFKPYQVSISCAPDSLSTFCLDTFMNAKILTEE